MKNFCVKTINKNFYISNKNTIFSTNKALFFLIKFKISLIYRNFNLKTAWNNKRIIIILLKDIRKSVICYMFLVNNIIKIIQE